VDKKLAAIVYSNLGLAYFKNKNYIKSELNCTEAIWLNENYHKAYVRRAEARRRLNKEIDAISDLRKASLL
jgi:Tfp pilus assembly protein PilF